MKFFVPIVIGAVIGYTTNWLAIKMLFRPHYEKRIFGIKIPFTPGLIPKEMDRIAKSTGEAIASHLITPETITKAIQGERMEESLRSSIAFSINKLMISNITIKEFVNSFGEGNYIKFLEYIESKIMENIMSRIEDDRFKESLKDGLNHLINQEFLMLLNDDRSLEEIIPNEITLRVKDYIAINKNKILNSLKELISSPNVKIKILKAIENMAEEKLPKLLTTFVSPKIISEKVYEAIDVQLNNENTGDDLVFAINEIIDKILKGKVSVLSTNINDNVSSEEITKLCKNIIINIYGEDNRGKLIVIVEEKIKEEIHEILDNFCNKEIKDIMKNIDNKTIDSIIKYTKMLAQRITIEKLPSFIETINIAKIVEDQINSFEVSYAEDIIMDISSKELKAITWLGALLGGLIGIITPLIS